MSLLWPREQSLALVPLCLGASSIASLLFYFYGVMEMGSAVRWILVPAILSLVVFVLRLSDGPLRRRTLAGLWAGALATLFYDLVRVPISASGIPVFKAISYFGTLILGQTTPTVASEVVGWSYHLTNGIGFGLMYAVILRSPALWSALVWGVTLEAAMLLTPYAEIFGYRISPGFLAITIGSHLVYGAVLYAGLRAWDRLEGGGRKSTLWRAGLVLLAPVGIGWIAADFFDRHAASIPPSPPTYIGSHLYTTWNALEPDRVVTLWAVRRWVDPDARFHYVEPFTHVAAGKMIDTPEADVRRAGTRSATEILFEELSLEGEPKADLLAEMTHLFEIARWRLPSRPAAFQLGNDLMEAAGECTPEAVGPCFERGMRYLDAWFEGAARQPED